MYYAYTRGLGDKGPVHHLKIYNYLVTEILGIIAMQIHDYQGRQVLDNAHRQDTRLSRSSKLNLILIMLDA